MILGLHIRNSLNAGDRHSNPLDYFTFPGHEIVIGDMRSPPTCHPDAVIYGGGSITASPDFHAWDCLTIGWGVGHHVRQRPWNDEMLAEHRRAAGMCDVYFPRDDVPGFDVVPDVSCMHQVFDEQLRPQHEVVRYSAARRVDVSGGPGPHMTNEDGDIVAAVRFLASGAKVVTSSYHGAYWARLLGREVELVTWGSKFFYMPDWTLAACRAANQRAYDQVYARING